MWCLYVNLWVNVHVCMEASTQDEVFFFMDLYLIIWDRISHWARSLPMKPDCSAIKAQWFLCTSSLALGLHMSVTVPSFTVSAGTKIQVHVVVQKAVCWWSYFPGTLYFFYFDQIRLYSFGWALEDKISHLGILNALSQCFSFIRKAIAILAVLFFIVFFFTDKYFEYILTLAVTAHWKDWYYWSIVSVWMNDTDRH